MSPAHSLHLCEGRSPQSLGEISLWVLSTNSISFPSDLFQVMALESFLILINLRLFSFSHPFACKLKYVKLHGTNPPVPTILSFFFNHPQLSSPTNSMELLLKMTVHFCPCSRHAKSTGKQQLPLFWEITSSWLLCLTAKSPDREPVEDPSECWSLTLFKGEIERKPRGGQELKLKAASLSIETAQRLANTLCNSYTWTRGDRCLTHCLRSPGWEENVDIQPKVLPLCLSSLSSANVDGDWMKDDAAVKTPSPFRISHSKDAHIPHEKHPHRFRCCVHVPQQFPIPRFLVISSAV